MSVLTASVAHPSDLLDPTYLQRLIGQIETLDDETSRHLTLLQRGLAARHDCAAQGRAGLIDRLERWRTQLLRRPPGELPASTRDLADVVDVLVQRLREAPPRPPRNTWSVVEHHPAPIDLRDEHLQACAAVLTTTHFGPLSTTDHARRAMTLYAPLYLSSYCVNGCTYCGFRFDNPIERRHLSRDEAVEQAQQLLARGFRHLLLVAGDFPQITSVDYYCDIVAALRQLGVSVAVEIAAQPTSGYAALADAGVCGVTLYQETYDFNQYTRLHPSGPKASYTWRLEAFDRAAEAGITELAMGVLLGLGDPLRDVATLAQHAHYLRERYPQVDLSFGLPRFHAGPDGFMPPHPVDDETLVALYAWLRCEFPTADLVLSTREAPLLRNRLAELCITRLSAGSSTTPGGYTDDTTHCDDGQFEIADHRSASEVAAWLAERGFAVRWVG